MERRDFISRWGRILLLGGMAATSGYLVGSGKISAGFSCSCSGECRNCSRLASCNALKRRKQEK